MSDRRFLLLVALRDAEAAGVAGLSVVAAADDRRFLLLAAEAPLPLPLLACDGVPGRLDGVPSAATGVPERPASSADAAPPLLACDGVWGDGAASLSEDDGMLCRLRGPRREWRSAAGSLAPAGSAVSVRHAKHV